MSLPNMSPSETYIKHIVESRQIIHIRDVLLSMIVVIMVTLSCLFRKLHSHRKPEPRSQPHVSDELMMRGMRFR